MVIDLLREHPGKENRAWILQMAHANLDIIASVRESEFLPDIEPRGGRLMRDMLVRALRERVGKRFRVDTDSLDRHVKIEVQVPEAILRVVVPRKRLFSSTTYVFVIWMVVTSLILFGIATIFMRNQVKAMRRLAAAADNFGKGRDVSRFKPEGATEVRQAAAAFLLMRDRIQRQIAQRTDMLAGVSHDLRTPLTRMKLQLALLNGKDEVRELEGDIVEMEHMLEGYLAFARGEGSEAPRPTNLSTILGEVVDQGRRKGGAIHLHTEGEIVVPVRPNAFRRCVTNLIDNAIRYGEHVSVRAGQRGETIEITIDDDGPGIPEERRTDVFKPFFRLEGSRNPGTGGVGLGLTISRDVVRGHGGDLSLSDAPNGGLRARLRLPL